MHIMFLSDNFAPEGNAPASRTFEHTREWVVQGHKVTVITSAPNFPEGRVYNGYQNRWIFREKMLGVNVWRVKTYIAKNEGFFRRIMDYLSFMITSFMFGLFVKKVDLIVGTSPQFFTAIAAWALAKIKKKPFVFEVRDIWPSSITAVGAMKKGLLISMLENIEMFLYGQADLIIVVTNSFRAELVERGVKSSKIKVILNGVDLDFYRPIGIKDPEFTKKYQLHSKIVVGYIGTLGLAHNLKNILRAAEILKNDRSIQFIIAGAGAEKDEIGRIIKEQDLKNVTIIPRQSKKDMPRLWSICDICLVSLKNSAQFKGVLPSKIFEAMGMGLPLIMSVPKGEATQLVLSARAGMLVDPDNHIELAETVSFLANNSEVRLELAKNSLNSSIFYGRSSAAKDLLRELVSLKC